MKDAFDEQCGATVRDKRKDEGLVLCERPGCGAEFDLHNEEHSLCRWHDGRSTPASPMFLGAINGSMLVRSAM